MVEKVHPKNRPALTEIAEILRAHGASSVYVFGSAAKGNFKAGSDVDIAVAGLPPEQYFVALARISAASDRPVDLIDLDEESPFVRHLLNEGLLELLG